MMKLTWYAVVMWCSIAYAADKGSDRALGCILEENDMSEKFDPKTPQGSLIAYKVEKDKWALGQIEAADGALYAIKTEFDRGMVVTSDGLRNIQTTR